MGTSAGEKWPLEERKRLYAIYAAAPRMERSETLKKLGLPGGRKGTDMMSAWRQYIDRQEGGAKAGVGKKGIRGMYSDDQKRAILDEYERAGGSSAVRAKYGLTTSAIANWRQSLGMPLPGRGGNPYAKKKEASANGANGMVVPPGAGTVVPKPSLGRGAGAQSRYTDGEKRLILDEYIKAAELGQGAKVLAKYDIGSGMIGYWRQSFGLPLPGRGRTAGSAERVAAVAASPLVVASAETDDLPPRKKAAAQKTCRHCGGPEADVRKAKDAMFQLMMKTPAFSQAIAMFFPEQLEE